MFVCTQYKKKTSKSAGTENEPSSSETPQTDANFFGLIIIIIFRRASSDTARHAHGLTP